jgi:hypothetical protein
MCAYMHSLIHVVFAAEELGRTSLILQCFSACPEVTWIKGWPASQPLIINASDIASAKVRVQASKTN